jgi:hypothetical protein
VGAALSGRGDLPPGGVVHQRCPARTRNDPGDAADPFTRWMPMRAFAVLAIPMLLAACGRDAVAPGAFTTSGMWTAEHEPYAWVLTLSQDGAAVRGSGELRTVADTLPLEVFGEWRPAQATPPEVGLTFQSPGYADVAFGGRFATADTLRGTLTGSGFSNDSLVLVRARP